MSQFANKRWARKYIVVSVDEARSTTGLEVDHLRAFGAEKLARTFADGPGGTALRLPIECACGSIASQPRTRD